MAADQESTKEWWEKRRHDFELFVSEVVVAESGRGDKKFAAARLEKLRGIPVLAPSRDGEQLAERLLEDEIIPSVAADDAVHLGFAAANKMDYLLTWNCSHINNRALLRRIERACIDCGLTCPVICTPTELMNPA